MNNLTFVFGAVLLCGAFACNKHNSGGSGSVPALDSVTIYSPSRQMTEIETFRFSGQRLMTFTDRVTDSSGGELYTEILVHSFQYSGNDNLPVSVGITDTVYNQNGTASGYFDHPIGFAFSYDRQGRLVRDTADVAGCCSPSGWIWDYSHDSIYVYEGFPNPPNSLFDILVISGGILTGFRNGTAIYGQTKNPLYDASIRNTFGPYFFSGGTEFLPQVGFAVYPVDFISSYLPASVNSIGQGGEISYSWNTGSNGRVSSGVIAGTQYGTMQVTFGYSQ